MAPAHLTRSTSVRKLRSAVTTQATGDLPMRERRARSCPTKHLTRDQYERLLACIEAVGVTTMDEISRALPQVAQPVSAVFDLCDAGILNVDWEAAFDGDMHVWRVDR